MDAGPSDGTTVSDEPPRVEKDRFTSLDTLALAREIRGLGRAHVDKGFDAGPGAWSLTLRAAGEGRRELFLHPGRYAALRAISPDHPEEPGPLARELRRLLSAAVVTDVPDPGGERYLEVILQRGDTPDPLRLAVEFFGAGNLLVARGTTIVAVAHPKSWAHRQVRVGAEYQPPPSRGDPWRRSEAELQVALAGSRTDRASTLAARLAFGGPIAEELLARTGLAGGEPASAEPARAAGLLHRAIAELLGELGERPRGYLYTRAGVLIDVEPFPARRWADDPAVQVEALDTFSTAADRFFRSTTPSPVAPAELRNREARAELERQRDRQQQAIVGLERSISEESARAEAVYAHYAEAERLRAAAEAAGGEAEYVETTLGGLRVPLLVRRPLEHSARVLYEEVKRHQSKLAGARLALVETEGRLAALRAETAPAAAARSAATSRPGRRAVWFEAFRWFLTSEGFLVVAGRDAGSNDRVVKRYLRPGDVYLHADLQGAASVIIKHSADTKTPIGDPSRREAGQFAVAFSKAWRAGLASASVFYVDPEQVSKAAATGEFVARGAFVIHGTKNFLRDLPLELGIGEVEVQGETRWSVAPPDALRARGRLRAIIEPGEERERPPVEIDLARTLGVSRSLLQSLLPAGGVSIRRT
jgi:predicted ribosome quality control (RQC) complex YloA/Tae2 family protein